MEEVIENQYSKLGIPSHCSSLESYYSPQISSSDIEVSLSKNRRIDLSKKWTQEVCILGQ